MRKGILEYCVLLYLSHVKAYPSDITEAMRRANLIVVEGTLYTLLNRLRREGKLDYEWRESRSGPPRKYYFITPAGAEMLALMRQTWEEILSSVDYFANYQPHDDEGNAPDASDPIQIQK